MRVALAVIACAVLAAGCGPPKRDAPPPKPPPAPAITADPAGPARATMIMVHAGGWAGHDARAQQLLMESPGKLLLNRNWRVVSIDYEEGAAGLDDVLRTVRAEIARGTSNGPLCLYGESSGGHLALVAAARLGGEIDCVIALGAPAELPGYLATAADGSSQHRIVAEQVRKFFGTSAGELGPWDPVSLAPKISADVLLLHEGDDQVVPVAQSRAFAAAHRATRFVRLDPGGADFLHGTISAEGRAAYREAIASLAARARERDRG